MGQFGQTNDLQEAIDQVANNNANNFDGSSNSTSENTTEDKSALDNIQSQLGVPPMPEPFPAPENAAPFSDILPPADNNQSADNTQPVDVAQPTSDAQPSDASSADATQPADASRAPETEGASNSDVQIPSAVTNPIDIVNPVESTPEPSVAPSAEQILSESMTGANQAEDGDLAQVKENILKDLMPLMDKVQGSPEEKFDIYKDAMDTLHDKNLISGAYKVATQITDESKKAESLLKLMQAIDK